MSSATIVGTSSHIAFSPLGGVSEIELTDGFVETEDDEENTGEDPHPGDVASNAVGEESSAQDGNAGVEELGSDSTDDDRVETIVGGKRDSDDLSLVTHLSTDKHDREENVGAGSAPVSAAAAEEVLDFLATVLQFLVSIMVMILYALKFLSLSNLFFSNGLGSAFSGSFVIIAGFRTRRIITAASFLLVVGTV